MVYLSRVQNKNCEGGGKTGRKKFLTIVVYYESIKGELQRRPIYECRCDARLKTKTDGSTRLTYTGFLGGLEHLKIETRLINERFPSVMGECVTLK
jgi:hypothetical protein